MEITRVKGSVVESTRFIVLRRFEIQEERVAREMGYAVDGRYCGDPACLGAEPQSGQAERSR